MGSRERKRVERRKRKERASQRQSLHADADPAPARNGATADEGADPVARMAARAEARNEVARARLEPLGEGERPLVVTIGAVVAAAIGALSVVGYLAGVEVTTFSSEGIRQGDDEAPLASVLVVVALMGVMAWGMWRARYWAVLGFQALLVIALTGAVLALVATSDWLQAVWATLLIAAAGTMFWFMIKAMARIQMPERR
jgi:hypothetical protein